jgi:hypothetical protein
MYTEFHASGHINSDGTLTIDEPIPLPAGSVEIVVRQQEEKTEPVSEEEEDAEATAAAERRIQLLREIHAALAARGPVKPKRMSDIDEIIYGPKAPYKGE